MNDTIIYIKRKHFHKTSKIDYVISTFIELEYLSNEEDQNYQLSDIQRPYLLLLIIMLLYPQLKTIQLELLLN
jgi:hypothetical protein